MCQWNHPLAAIVPIRWPESGRKRSHRRLVGPPDSVVGNHPVAETTEFGSICWPKPQIHCAQTKLLNWKVIATIPDSVMHHCHIVDAELAEFFNSDVSRLSTKNVTSFDAPDGNHPLANPFRKHPMDKTANGWVE